MKIEGASGVVPLFVVTILAVLAVAAPQRTRWSGRQQGGVRPDWGWPQEQQVDGQGQQFGQQGEQFGQQQGQFGGQQGQFGGQQGQFGGQQGQFGGQQGQFGQQQGQFGQQQGQFGQQQGQFGQQQGQFGQQQGQPGQQQGQPGQQQQQQVGGTTPAPADGVLTVLPASCTCMAPSQYNPVCGSDGNTYMNKQKLECFAACGSDVTYMRLGVCKRRQDVPT